MKNVIEETKEKLEENEKKEETKEEKEIKELKEKNEKLEDENKLLRKEYKIRFMKSFFKYIKLIIFAFFGWLIFYVINNFTNNYYTYKNNNPIKDCCDIEKNYAIKESEFQKRIAELQKEIYDLKSKTKEVKKETSSIKTTKTQITKNSTNENSQCEKLNLLKQ